MNKNEYWVSISETFVKMVKVEAESEKDAEEITKKKFGAGEYTFGSGDTLTPKFAVLEQD